MISNPSDPFRTFICDSFLSLFFYLSNQKSSSICGTVSPSSAFPIFPRTELHTMSTNNRYNPSAQRRPQQLEPSTRRRPSAQRRDRPLSPTASKAGALKLSREKTISRKHQRPWTLKEWEFVKTIPKDIDEEGMKRLCLSKCSFVLRAFGSERFWREGSWG
jgi:hypothetical protein